MSTRLADMPTRQVSYSDVVMLQILLLFFIKGLKRGLPNNSIHARNGESSVIDFLVAIVDGQAFHCENRMKRM